QARKELRKERWAVLDRYAEKVDAQVDRGVFENRQDLVDARRAPLIADRHHGLQRTVVAFRIDDADLVRLVDQAFHETGRQRGFAAARRPGDQHVAAVRRNTYGSAVVGTRAQEQQVAVDL